ncbi:hypothetical protein [Ammoniphilus sp. CFH 90114]|uniref:YphA family membrane protein n=1 Tax=Ammoniphilus sp. CFH 90114 TaxID=2493665 RepID=UPI00100FCB82|nr:hypothetical protein [Ammoniphilus sp. CFH 90114]RXT13888.1 hypothetical protein EIZ39_07050 [Ammoniphilus sp. CFH 90114]
MNDGFFSLIGIWFLLLFVWLGFCDRLLTENKWRKKWTVIILMVSLGTLSWTVPLPMNGELVVMSSLFPMLLGSWLWMKQGDNHRLHLLTASFLVGASVFLLQLLLRLDPVLMFIEEKYMIAGFVMVLILVAARSSIQQFILLTLGLGFGDLCFQAYMWDKTGYYLIGSPFFQDTWWISFYLLWLIQFVLLYVRSPQIWKRKRAETS